MKMYRLENWMNHNEQETLKSELENKIKRVKVFNERKDNQVGFGTRFELSKESECMCCLMKE